MALDKKTLADRWSFQWPIYEVLLGGSSPIDLEGMATPTWEQATEFLAAYGYDPNVPRDQKVIHGAMVEAVAFIQRHLITPKQWSMGLRPPLKIEDCQDARWLILWASGIQSESPLCQAWACAVLRVMHTIAHIDGVNRLVDLDVARDQIFSHIHRFVARTVSGGICIGSGDFFVDINLVQWKDVKPRDSIILKLLHKRNNVAEAIFDYVGIRIVVPRLIDVPLVVKCLRQCNVLVYPNVYPARSRNNLIDFNLFKVQIEALRSKLLQGAISEEEFEDAVSRLQIGSPLGEVGPTNPHSLDTYRSVQLTGRFLVKFVYDGFEWLRKIREYRQQGKGASPLAQLDDWIGGWFSTAAHLDSEVFFPFEIQIMDLESFNQAATGAANHDQYKKSQLKSARKRVLSTVLELHRLEDSQDSQIVSKI